MFHLRNRTNIRYNSKCTVFMVMSIMRKSPFAHNHQNIHNIIIDRLFIGISKKNFGQKKMVKGVWGGS